MQLRSRSSAPADPKRGLQPIHAPLGDSNSMIKPMLTRLETALGSESLMQKMVLLSRPNPPRGVDETAEKTIDFVVGYSGSANSQGALDIALGSLNAHLRVGPVATELSQVAEELQAEVLMVGCQSTHHRLVQQLAHQTPCSVLGLPQ